MGMRDVRINGMLYRKLMPIGEGYKTLNDEARTVEVVGATESPVKVRDWEFGDVDEILLMSGVNLPDTKRLPLLDSHNRQESSSVLGSFRNIKVRDGQLVGTVEFSSEAGSIFTKFKEGHLTDFSVGYTIEKREFVDVGNEFNGLKVKSPTKYVTKWTPRELSITPIGADKNAKARSESVEEREMEEKVEMSVSKEPEVDVSAIVGAERERVSEISVMCRKFNIDEKTMDNMIRTGVSVDAARSQILDVIETRQVVMPHRVPATVVEDERDKFRSAAEIGLLIRSGMNVQEEQRKIGMDVAGFTMLEMARTCLRMANLKHTGDVRDVVGRALTTSDFPYILANVANKSLFEGWQTAGETWSQWCATGSVSDFKTYYSPRISEFSSLDEIAEMEEYKYGKRTEAQEEYKIATYGKLGAISRQAIINDDLNVITVNMMAMGEAAARKIGDLPYDLLVANANMGDLVPLFNASHSNYVGHGSGAPPGVATMAAAVLAMGMHKDLQGLRRLNITPEYFIAPRTLEGNAEIFFRTGNYADSNTIATDSSLAATRVNPYSGTRFNRIYESRLDDADPAAWYLAARKGRTVTMFFLNGVQSPYFETKQGWSVDGTEFKVRIDAGCKAMDYRGLYYNDGN